ncbi:pro-pol polyprotein [Plakobranchus ocellatus]|uniref:Pro-pol polyprotein n=1 Tax=Plakobranchus ocellatus TaxID=259542 RepID=A0AAV4CKA4_9GAST|nr:pro-pol polyprotein [Plakobranchus ocellatus]
MRTQAYNMATNYKPGEDNPADYMSKHPNKSTKPSSREQKIAEYVNNLAYNSTPKAMILENIESETLKDRTLQAGIAAMKTGNWTQTSNFHSLEKHTHYTLNRCVHELSITETGLILKERRIVLPFSLQDKAVQIAHSGHQGKTKTLSMLREKVWFKNMHTAVEQAVKNCLACQVATPTTTREPLQMSDLPQEPWSKLSADFGHLPDGTYLLVVTAEYSHFVVVDTIKSTSARAVIPRFDKSLLNLEFQMN